MATSITTNYAGQESADIIGKALLSGFTLAGEYITINSDVKYKLNLRKLDVSGLLVAGTCDFTDAGTATMTERVLTLTDVQVNKKECKKTFRPYWKSLDDEATAIADYYSKYVSSVVEDLIWNGSVAGGDLIDGFKTLALADATVIDVSTPVALTKANILSEIERALVVVPTALLSDPEMTIFLSSMDFMLFQQAQNSLGTATNAGFIGLSNYGQFKVVQTGLDKDDFIIASKSNLHFGTDLTSADNSVRIIDMADKDGSDNIHFVMRTAIGVQYAWGAEIVLYGV